MTIQYAVLFDMDGTLLQTEKLATPAFLRTFDDLRKQQLWDGRTPTESELTNVLGMTLEDLWKTLLPDANHEVKLVADRLMLQHELDLLKEGITDLYPGVREVLRELKSKDVSLFVASNGLEKYIDAVCEHFGLKAVFTDLYSAGRFQTKSKNDLVSQLINDYAIQQAVMVGDRRSDVEAGKANQLLTIGCDFGFAKPGELEQADQIITQFDQLITHLPFPVLHKT